MEHQQSKWKGDPWIFIPKQCRRGFEELKIPFYRKVFRQLVRFSHDNLIDDIEILVSKENFFCIYYLKDRLKNGYAKIYLKGGDFNAIFVSGGKTISDSKYGHSGYNLAVLLEFVFTFLKKGCRPLNEIERKNAFKLWDGPEIFAIVN